MRLPTFQEIAADEKELAVYNLPAEGKWLISGPPGSGKTIMALYRTKRLAHLKGSGSQMMFAVYNHTLNRYLQDAIRVMAIDGVSSTWYSWFCSFYSKVMRSWVP